MIYSSALSNIDRISIVNNVLWINLLNFLSFVLEEIIGINDCLRTYRSVHRYYSNAALSHRIAVNGHLKQVSFPIAIDWYTTVYNRK